MTPEQSIRLECLKIAANQERVTTEVLAKAKAYEDFVNKSETSADSVPVEKGQAEISRETSKQTTTGTNNKKKHGNFESLI
jgi:hypothetical protein